MKIIIFSPTSTVFNFREPQPLGGADSALMRMIGILGIHHEVEAYIPMTKEDAGQHGQAKCFPFMVLFEKKSECDILIFYRKIWAIPNTVKYKKLVFYSQDSIETPCFNGIKDKTCFDIFDRVILLSEFHKQNFLEGFNYPQEKITLIGNAAEERTKIEKKPLTFIYFSTPYRGLVVLMKMWKKIIERYPTAKLHVFSSMAIYGAKKLDELHFKPMLEGLDRMQGVVSHGSRPHDEVMEQLDKSFMLLYPNTYPETYCNVVMESRAAHTPFITSKLGALPETGGKAGLYVNGRAYSEEYQTDFLDKLFFICDNMDSSGKVLYEVMQKECYPIRTWQDYAKDLLNEINRLSKEIKD